MTGPVGLVNPGSDTMQTARHALYVMASSHRRSRRMQCAREALAPNPPFRATLASRVGRRPLYRAWHRRPPRSASPAKLRTASRTAPSRNGRRPPSPATLRAGRRTPLPAARRGEKRAIERERDEDEDRKQIGEIRLKRQTR